MATDSNNTASATENVLFGLVININGIDFAVSADPKTALADGMKFKIDTEDKDLGNIADLISWFNSNFGVNIPDGTNLPSPLGDIIGKIEELNFTIDQLDMNLPLKGNKEYTLKFSASWEEGQEPEIIKGIKLQGGSFFGTNVNEDGSGSDT